MKDELVYANIAYLDDEENFRNDLKNYLDEKKYRVTTLKSIAEIDNLSANDSSWILICDLRLDDFEIGAKGDRILNKIREGNKEIFLALLTNFSSDITKLDKLLMDSNNIKIYSKGDYEEFILNLNRDYNNFLQLRNDRKIPELRVYSSVKNHILFYLKSIQDQNLEIPITGRTTSYTAKKLIAEVENNTSDVGLDYIDDWLNTYSVINSVKSGN